MRRTLAGAVCGWVLMGVGVLFPAAANAAWVDGDNKPQMVPTVTAGFCDTWCGPTVLVPLTNSQTVHTDLPYERSMTLTKADGTPVPVSNVRQDYTTPSDGNTGAALEAATPTGLPDGTYTVTWQLSQAGHWNCSVWYHDGCLWFDTHSANGTNTVVWVAPPPTPKTCVDAPKAAAACTAGLAWTYDLCWRKPPKPIVLQQFIEGKWVDVQRLQAVKSVQTCGKKYAYEIQFTRTEPDRGTYTYRLAMGAKGKGKERIKVTVS